MSVFISACIFAGGACATKFPAVEVVVGDMFSAVEAPPLDVILFDRRLACVVWYCQAAPPEVPEVCVVWGKGVARWLCWDIAAHDPGTTVYRSGSS